MNSNLRDNTDGTCNCRPLGRGCFNLLKEERLDAEAQISARWMKFVDEKIADERKRIVEIAEGLKPTNIEWTGTTDEEKNHLLAYFDGRKEGLTDLISKLK